MASGFPFHPLLLKVKLVAFSATHWDCRNRADLIKSAAPCNAAQVVGPYQVSNPLHLTVVTSKSDYTTALQCFQIIACLEI